MKRALTTVLAAVALVAFALFALLQRGADERPPSVAESGVANDGEDATGAAGAPGGSDGSGASLEAPVRARRSAPTPEAAPREAPGASLEGTVFDDRGLPVEPFSVSLQHFEAGEWSVESEQEHAGGSFARSDLASGRWRLHVRAAGYRSVTRNVRLREGEREQVEVVLERLALVRGRVVGPDGSAASDATVHRGADPAVAVRADGSFELELGPGAHELFARSPNAAPSAPREVTLELGQELDGVTLELTLGGTLTGEIRDDDDRLLGGWWLQLASADWRAGKPRGQADADGRFRFEHLAPGNYSVNALEAEQDAIGSTPYRETVTVVEGETTHVVVGGVQAEALEIRGRVTLEGYPVRGKLVWLLNEGPRSYASGRTEKTDDDGRFVLLLAKPGPAMVLVSLGALSSEDVPGANIDLDGDAGAVTYHFDFGPAGGHDIELVVPSAEVRGVVLDEDGDPKRGKIVRLVPEGEGPVGTQFRSRNARTERDGTFRFAYLPAGTYRVSLARGYGAQTRLDGVVVAEGQHVEDVVLRMAETGDVRVRVVDRDGAPFGGAYVYAHDEHGRAWGVDAQHVRSQADGEARFRRLAAGGYRFVARAEGLVSSSALVTDVVAGEESELTLQLDAEGGFLELELVDDAGRAVRAAFELTDPAGRHYERLRDGFDFDAYLDRGYSSTRRRFGALPPGEYRVSARAEDGRLASRVLRVEAGSEQRASIALGGR